jgi:hypothetical protein
MHFNVGQFVGGSLFFVGCSLIFIFRVPVARRAATRQRARFGAWASVGSTPHSYGIISGLFALFGLFLMATSFF